VACPTVEQTVENCCLTFHFRFSGTGDSTWDDYDFIAINDEIDDGWFGENNFAPDILTTNILCEDPDKHYWYAIFNDESDNIVILRADRYLWPDCPPTHPGDWVLFSSTFGTSISWTITASDCP
jgi:hypothetical protein